MASPAPAKQPEQLPLITCIALCGMAPLAGLSVSGIAPLMPQISEEFAGNPNADVLVRLMMSGLSAATIVGALGTGVMAARVGTTRLLILLLAAYAVTGAGIYFLDNLYVMVAARLLQGVANGGAGVLALTLLTTRIPAGRRDSWLGFFSVSGAAGFLLLIMVVGVLAQFGWRFGFLIFLLAVPVALLIGFTLHEGKSERFAAEEAPQPGRPPGIPWGMVLFGVLCGGLSTTTSMYLPYYLADIGQGSPDTVAMVLMIGGGASALTAFAFGWIRARLSAIRTFVFAFALIACGLLVVSATGAMAVIVGGWTVYGLGLGLIMPNLFSASAGATPAVERARMLGFVRSGVYGGPLLIQPGLEAALRLSGAFAALIGIALLGVLAGVLTVALRKVFDPVE